MSAATFSTTLDVPPSVNERRIIVVNRRRMVKRSARYDAWMDKAVFLLRAQVTRTRWRTVAHCGVAVELGIGYGSDCDNRLKPVMDALQRAGIIEDDRYVETITVARLCGNMLRVTVSRVEPSRPCTRCDGKKHRVT